MKLFCSDPPDTALHRARRACRRTVSPAAADFAEGRIPLPLQYCKDFPPISQMFCPVPPDLFWREGNVLFLRTLLKGTPRPPDAGRSYARRKAPRISRGALPAAGCFYLFRSRMERKKPDKMAEHSSSSTPPSTSSVWFKRLLAASSAVIERPFCS